MENKKRILVVDDDSAILKVFDFGLKSAGYELVVVSSGDSAVKEVKKNGFDLIFMDVKMPRMNGIEAFRSIKDINSAIPVIMMTGYSVDQLLKEAFELGAYGCLYKPFEMEEVLAVVEKTLKPQQV